MTIETLLLLQRCLDGQQLVVGDLNFEAMAEATLRAKRELRDAIAEAEANTPQP